MAIAFVADRINFGSSAASAAHVVAISNPTAITVGNYLIIGVTNAGSNVGVPTSITDPRGNTWRDTGVVADNGANHSYRKWYAKVGIAYQAGDSITINLGASRFMACDGGEFSGLDPTDTTVLDKIANAADTVGTDTAFDTGATAATTVADELLFGGIGSAAAINPTPEVLSPVWNTVGNAASTTTVRRVWTFYRIVAATGTYQFKGTLAIAGLDSEGIATFKAASTAAFDPSAGFPWNHDEGESFVQAQLWPDPTTELGWPPAVPVAAPVFDPAAGFPWAREGGEVVALPTEDPTVPAWAVGPPQNAVRLQEFAVEGGEVQAVPGEDPSIQAWAVPPPLNAVQLQAWSREGEETIAVPTEDPTVPAWAVGPPQNAVRLQAFNTPDEATSSPVDDPTGQTYPIEPPAAAAFDPATGFPWLADDGERFVQSTFWPDLTEENGGYVPPQLQAFTQPDETIAAAATEDPTGQSYAIAPPAFDPASAFPFNVPQEVTLEAGDDPTTPALTVPSYLPGFPFNADDGERFAAQQLSDDNVGYALGLVPPAIASAQAFNVPQDAAAEPLEDLTRQAWAIQPPAPVVVFDPSTGFPFNRDDSERFFDPRWTFLAALASPDTTELSQVPVYPIPPNPVTAPGLSPDPWFRRLPVPSGIAIEAWSLYVSLVGRYGLAEGRQVYERMLAERKGPFQAGAKYDPDRYGSRPVIPHIEIPKAKRN